MSNGLTVVGFSSERDLKPEFVTYTDPFIMEAFESINAPFGLYATLEGYSRSYYSKEAHIASIMKYDKIDVAEPSNDEWIAVKSETTSLFRSFTKVRVFSAKAETKHFGLVKYHQGTSAGYNYNRNPPPFPSHKGTREQANYQRARNIASKIVHECETHFKAGTWDTYLKGIPMDSTPDVAFTRTQLTELPKTKVRNVFGEAFHYVLLEGLIAQPLIEAFMKMKTFYFIGEDPLYGVPTLLETIQPDREQFLVFDWSGFDSSVSVFEIELAFNLLKEMIIFPDETTSLIFEYVKTLFISRKLASPDGRIFLRRGGIPSGSYFTHLVGSIINYVRINYLFKRINVPIDSIRTHGDDSFVVPGKPVDELTGIILEAAKLGWFISDKSILTACKHEVEFLGRSSKFGTSYRDSLKALRLLAFPEYPVDDPQISIARLKGIDVDTGSRVRFIPEIYQYLRTKYGDQNVKLPSQFERFTFQKFIALDDDIFNV